MIIKMDFGKKARKHQELFKLSSDTFSENSKISNDGKGQRNGHLLKIGCEMENLYPTLRFDAVRYLNQRSIPWWQSERSGDDMNENHPTRNLASSQVACVNFLMFLADKVDLLTRILKTIDNDITSISEIKYINPATKMEIYSNIEFEWIGLNKPLEMGVPYTRGQNVTSIDAFIIGNYPMGKRAYLFEWKYVEFYSEKDYKGFGKSGDIRRKRYSDMFASEKSPFVKGTNLEDFLYEPFYQIMRLFLLGNRMVQYQELGVNDFRVVVVVPKSNIKYRNTITSKPIKVNFQFVTIEDAIKYYLKNNNAFRIISQNFLLENIISFTDSEWLNYMKERYFDDL